MTQVDRRAIIARQNEDLDDWFRLEWLEHDGRKWNECVKSTHSGHIYTHCHISARLESGTCCEGTRREMLGIARAILSGEEESFKRCAVRPDGDYFAFWSPRNSNGKEALVHGEDARAWATAFLGQP